MTAPPDVLPAHALQPRLDMPFSHGVLLAVNAIADACLLLDAPTCAHGHVEMIQMHDWSSTLLSYHGRPRVLVSEVTPTKVVGDRAEALSRSLGQLARSPGCGVVLAFPFPMVELTGVRYEPLLSLDSEPPVPLVEVRSDGLDVNWLDGYARTLEALALALPLRPAPRPDAVAVVGHLMDRNELEQVANVEELSRMLGALDLELVSVWLSGGPYEALRRVEQASAIVSLPYAREAARALADKTGARLIEADLPFGLDGTVRFVETIARAMGRQETASAFVEQELRAAVGHMRWIVDRGVLPTRLLFCGDPYHVPGLEQLASDLGCTLVEAYVTGQQRHLARMIQGPESPVATEAGMADLLTAAAALADAPGRPLLIHCSTDKFPAPLAPATPALSFGFPSFQRHGLGPSPYLGFRGVLGFLDRVLAASAPC